MQQAEHVRPRLAVIPKALAPARP